MAILTAKPRVLYMAQSHEPTKPLQMEIEMHRANLRRLDGRERPPERVVGPSPADDAFIRSENLIPILKNTLPHTEFQVSLLSVATRVPAVQDAQRESGKFCFRAAKLHSVSGRLDLLPYRD
jgi:hypothetical protein